LATRRTPLLEIPWTNIVTEGVDRDLIQWSTSDLTLFFALNIDLSLFDNMEARQAPEGLVGIHTNLLVTALANAEAPPAEPSEQERAALDALATFRTSGSGYFVEQATRPQTIGHALLIHRSPWRPGCWTTTPTATTRSPAPFSTGSPRAI
jgi:hypothetical protein